MDDAKSKSRGELKDELYLFSIASLVARKRRLRQSPLAAFVQGKLKPARRAAYPPWVIAVHGHLEFIIANGAAPDCGDLPSHSTTRRLRFCAISLSFRYCKRCGLGARLLANKRRNYSEAYRLSQDQRAVRASAGASRTPGQTDTAGRA